MMQPQPTLKSVLTDNKSIPALAKLNNELNKRPRVRKKRSDKKITEDAAQQLQGLIEAERKKTQAVIDGARETLATQKELTASVTSLEQWADSNKDTLAHGNHQARAHHEFDAELPVVPDAVAEERQAADKVAEQLISQQQELIPADEGGKLDATPTGLQALIDQFRKAKELTKSVTEALKSVDVTSHQDAEAHARKTVVDMANHARLIRQQASKDEMSIQTPFAHMPSMTAIKLRNWWSSELSSDGKETATLLQEADERMKGVGEYESYLRYTTDYDASIKHYQGLVDQRGAGAQAKDPIKEAKRVIAVHARELEIGKTGQAIQALQQKYDFADSPVKAEEDASQQTTAQQQVEDHLTVLDQATEAEQRAAGDLTDSMPDVQLVTRMAHLKRVEKLLDTKADCLKAIKRDVTEVDNAKRSNQQAWVDTLQARINVYVNSAQAILDQQKDMTNTKPSDHIERIKNVTPSVTILSELIHHLETLQSEHGRVVTQLTEIKQQRGELIDLVRQSHNALQDVVKLTEVTGLGSWFSDDSGRTVNVAVESAYAVLLETANRGKDVTKALEQYGQDLTEQVQQKRVEIGAQATEAETQAKVRAAERDTAIADAKQLSMAVEQDRQGLNARLRTSKRAAANVEGLAQVDELAAFPAIDEQGLGETVPVQNKKIQELSRQKSELMAQTGTFVELADGLEEFEREISEVKKGFDSIDISGAMAALQEQREHYQAMLNAAHDASGSTRVVLDERSTPDVCRQQVRQAMAMLDKHIAGLEDKLGLKEARKNLVDVKQEAQATTAVRLKVFANSTDIDDRLAALAEEREVLEAVKQQATELRELRKSYKIEDDGSEERYAQDGIGRCELEVRTIQGKAAQTIKEKEAQIAELEKQKIAAPTRLEDATKNVEIEQTILALREELVPITRHAEQAGVILGEESSRAREVAANKAVIASSNQLRQHMVKRAQLAKDAVPEAVTEGEELSAYEHMVTAGVIFRESGSGLTDADKTASEHASNVGKLDEGKATQVDSLEEQQQTLKGLSETVVARGEGIFERIRKQHSGLVERLDSTGSFEDFRKRTIDYVKSWFGYQDRDVDEVSSEVKTLRQLQSINRKMMEYHGDNVPSELAKTGNQLDTRLGHLTSLLQNQHRAFEFAYVEFPDGWSWSLEDADAVKENLAVLDALIAVEKAIDKAFSEPQSRPVVTNVAALEAKRAFATNEMGEAINRLDDEIETTVERLLDNVETAKETAESNARQHLAHVPLLEEKAVITKLLGDAAAIQEVEEVLKSKKASVLNAMDGGINKLSEHLDQQNFPLDNKDNITRFRDLCELVEARKKTAEELGMPVGVAEGKLGAIKQRFQEDYDSLVSLASVTDQDKKGVVASLQAFVGDLVSTPSVDVVDDLARYHQREQDLLRLRDIELSLEGLPIELKVEETQAQLEICKTGKASALKRFNKLAARAEELKKEYNDIGGQVDLLTQKGTIPTLHKEKLFYYQNKGDLYMRQHKILSELEDIIGRVECAQDKLCGIELESFIFQELPQNADLKNPTLSTQESEGKGVFKQTTEVKIARALIQTEMKAVCKDLITSSTSLLEALKSSWEDKKKTVDSDVTLQGLEQDNPWLAGIEDVAEIPELKKAPEVTDVTQISNAWEKESSNTEKKHEERGTFEFVDGKFVAPEGSESDEPIDHASLFQSAYVYHDALQAVGEDYEKQCQAVQAENVKMLAGVVKRIAQQHRSATHSRLFCVAGNDAVDQRIAFDRAYQDSISQLDDIVSGKKESSLEDVQAILDSVNATTEGCRSWLLGKTGKENVSDLADDAAIWDASVANAGSGFNDRDALKDIRERVESDTSLSLDKKQAILEMVESRQSSLNHILDASVTESAIARVNGLNRKTKAVKEAIDALRKLAEAGEMAPTYKDTLDNTCLCAEEYLSRAHGEQESEGLALLQQSLEAMRTFIDTDLDAVNVSAFEAKAQEAASFKDASVQQVGNNMQWLGAVGKLLGGLFQGNQQEMGKSLSKHMRDIANIKKNLDTPQQQKKFKDMIMEQRERLTASFARLTASLKSRVPGFQTSQKEIGVGKGYTKEIEMPPMFIDDASNPESDSMGTQEKVLQAHNELCPYAAPKWTEVKNCAKEATNEGILPQHTPTTPTISTC